MNGTLLFANGFLPTRGSMMLDMVVVAMAIVLIGLGISIAIVRSRRDFRLHRSIQITLTVLLTIAIVLFECDVRFFTDWRDLAKASPYYDSGVVHISLWIHLVFAIPTPFLWGFVLWKALTSIEWDSEVYRQKHRFWGRIAAGMMLLTALTGWTFYWLAFVAVEG